MAQPEDIYSTGAAAGAGAAAPITDVRVNSKFCFVELRSIEEATNALNLNGIPFAGQALNIKRSSKHDASLGPLPSAHHTWDSLLASWMSGELKVVTSGAPTRVLCVTNMVAAADLQSEDQFDDLIEDTLDECKQYGKVRSVFVERAQAQEAVAKGGAGRLFVETESVEDAQRVCVALKGRCFDTRTVDVKFYPEDAWEARQYQQPLPAVIVAAAGAIPLAAVFARRE